jgi:basic membrane protein A and related proteins
MKKSRLAFAAFAALGLVAAACGSDKKADSTSAPTPAATAAPTTVTATVAKPAETTAPAPETTAKPADTTPAPAAQDLDTNGDGKVLFGVAAAGPRDDGAYYQALVDKTISVSKEKGFADPIIVDKISSENAATELGNLAEQNVDVILVGASEIADPLKDLIPKYPKIFWYCNCGAGYPSDPGLAQSQDDSSEISYTAGFATGLLLKKSGGDSAAFIGCCDLNFEKEAYLAYEMGLKAVDPAFKMTYIPSGAFQFDFDNTAGATEALNGAITAGADAVYPYLGGAHEPLVKIANEKKIIVMSAGSSKACARSDLKYDIQVRFDGGDYLDTNLTEIISGKFKEGDTRVFHVGVDPEPGAEICAPTPEDTSAMETVYKDIASGKYAGDFGAIKGKAYAGG